MPPMKLEIGVYNQLPAICRKTVGRDHIALINGVWREVELVRPQKAVPPATCLSIPDIRR